MKKILSLTALCVALLAFSTTKSAAQAYQNGRNYLNAGIGLGTYGGGGLGLNASFEHGFTDQISAGGIVAYSRYNFGVLDYRWNFLMFGARGSYHLTELLNINNDKLDLYAGLGLGYRAASYSGPGGSYVGTLGSGVFFMGHVGARYFFSENVGGFAEAGAGVSNLLLGVTFKF
jgi:hypothetical protein